MSDKLQEKLNQYSIKRKRRKRWKKLFNVLAAITVFCTTYALILPAITIEAEVFCGYEEHVEHDNKCYEQQKILICERCEEEGHVHNENCYEEQRSLNCTLEETDGHAHSEDCYREETVLFCEQEESEGHLHSADCFDENGEIICGINEGEGAHIHDENCFRKERCLICEIPACEPHHHTEACYQSEKVLICSLPEQEPHTHGENCYEITDTLVCELPLHEHTLQSFADATADVENEAIWIKTFSDADLSGDWAEDAIAIARSQLGYAESERNYLVMDDGITVKGYTRYGEWYGFRYSDWSAAFCSFCLYYAGVDVDRMPLAASCEDWIQRLSEIGLYDTAADETVPNVGDLVFFDYDRNGEADQVGFITDVTGEGFLTIEGNKNDRVDTGRYSYENTEILGYGRIPETTETDAEEETEASPIPEETEEILLETNEDATRVTLSDVSFAGFQTQLFSAVTENGFTITADPEKDNYLPGDVITFHIRYTNMTGGKLTKWNIIPSVSGDATLISEAPQTVLADLNAGVEYANEITYQIQISDSVTDVSQIDFSASVQLGTEDKKTHLYSFAPMSPSVETTASVTAIPLTGVRIIESSEDGSNLATATVSGFFSLRNYDPETTAYSYHLSVYSNETVLSEDTDYTAIFTSAPKESLGADETELLPVTILLNGIPVPGTTIRVELEATDENGIHTNESFAVSRPTSDVTIRADREGPYLAGSQVTFTVTYTNSTGARIDANKNLTLIVSGGPEGATWNNVSSVYGQNLNNGASCSADFTLTLPKDYSTEELWQYVTAQATTVAGTLGEDTASFKITPLTGILITDAVDNGTVLKSGQVNALFTLENYEDADFDYSARYTVSKNGVLLAEGTDYILTGSLSKDGTMAALLTATDEVAVELTEIPQAGDCIILTMTVVDEAGKESSKSVSVTRPITDIVVIPDHDGPYLEGSEVTFTVIYTNNTGNRYKPTLSLSADDPKLSFTPVSVTSSADVSNGGVYQETFTMKIPEGYTYSSDWLSVTATASKSGVEQASDSYSFKIKPLEGVMVLDARDSSSNMGTKELQVCFDLKNYNSTATSYRYDLAVTSGGELVPSDAYTVEWIAAMPGSDKSTENPVMTKKSTATAEAKITFADPDRWTEPFTVRLSVHSVQETEQEVTLTRTSLEGILPSGLIKSNLTYGGLELLYYGNVKDDERVPFHSAAQLYELLTTSSQKRALEIWNRYKYDLYDPNCFTDTEATTTGNKSFTYSYETKQENSSDYVGKYPRFEDALLAYPKEENSLTPFHNLIPSEINPLKYSLEDEGVTYDDYFSNLKKTAGPDLGDNNAERTYTVELSAETNPEAVTPKVIIIQIQTSWQMFDLLHANATKTNAVDLIGMDPWAAKFVGSCSSNTELANLYDIKQALIRFVEYLKEYDDGSVMVAITNVQHDTTHTMVGVDDGASMNFTNDMDALLEGLYAWDTFGDCEHVHYSAKALQAAIGNITKLNNSWTDADGVLVNGTGNSNAEVSVVVIGGPTENTNGTDGYGIPLTNYGVASIGNDGTVTNGGNIDHVYGIRVNKGTNVSGAKNSFGDDIISWLDIDNNQKIFRANGNGFYVSTTEDDVYAALRDIVGKSSDDAIVESASVKNVKIVDTITDEFAVGTIANPNTASAVRVYLTDKSGNKTQLRTDEYTVSIVPNADNTTSVEVSVNEILGKKTVTVDIDIQARADYIGSNNVYTNVNTEDIGPAIVSYQHDTIKTEDGGNPTTITKTYAGAEFTEKPRVHVPLLEIVVEDGMEVTRVPGDSVNLAEIAYAKDGQPITAKIEELIHRYDQINGTLTIQWVDSEGNPIGEALNTAIMNGESEPISIPSFEYVTTVGDIGQTKTYQLRATLSPCAVASGNTNVVPVGPVTDLGTVKINVITDAMTGTLKIRKTDTGTKALNDVEFSLFAADEDWKETGEAIGVGKTATADGRDGYLSFADLEPGRYVLIETGVPEGYFAPEAPFRVTVDADGTVHMRNPDGTAPETEEDIFRIINVPIYRLPDTGGVGTHSFTLGGIALLCTALMLGWSFIRNRYGKEDR